jgi:hypothetical protein
LRAAAAGATASGAVGEYIASLKAPDGLRGSATANTGTAAPLLLKDVEM